MLKLGKSVNLLTDSKHVQQQEDLHNDDIVSDTSLMSIYFQVAENRGANFKQDIRYYNPL